MLVTALPPAGPWIPVAMILRSPLSRAGGPTMLAGGEAISYAAPQADDAPRTPKMGHRLSKIVTRTGDDGTRGLGEGSGTGKDSARIAAIGDIDELSSTLGVLLAESLPQGVSACLIAVQHDLFDLGGELSIPGYTTITDAQVVRLEEA